MAPRMVPRMAPRMLQMAPPSLWLHGQSPSFWKGGLRTTRHARQRLNHAEARSAHAAGDSPHRRAASATLSRPMFPNVFSGAARVTAYMYSWSYCEFQISGASTTRTRAVLSQPTRELWSARAVLINDFPEAGQRGCQRRYAAGGLHADHAVTCTCTCTCNVYMYHLLVQLRD